MARGVIRPRHTVGEMVTTALGRRRYADHGPGVALACGQLDPRLRYGSLSASKRGEIRVSGFSSTNPAGNRRGPAQFPETHRSGPTSSTMHSPISSSPLWITTWPNSHRERTCSRTASSARHARTWRSAEAWTRRPLPLSAWSAASIDIEFDGTESRRYRVPSGPDSTARSAGHLPHRGPVYRHAAISPGPRCG